MNSPRLVIFLGLLSAAVTTGCAAKSKESKPATQPAPTQTTETAGPLTGSTPIDLPAATLDSDQNQSFPPPPKASDTVSPESLTAPALPEEFAHLAPPPAAPGSEFAPPPAQKGRRKKAAAKAMDSVAAEEVETPEGEGLPSGRDRAVCPNLAQVNDKLVIHHIYVGQGDSTYIRTPGGGVSILIDGGESGNQTEIAEILATCYRTREVDYLVLTHPHSDHFGGLTQLMKMATANPPTFKINRGVYMTAFDVADLTKNPRDPGLRSKTEAFMRLAIDINARVRQPNLVIPYGEKAFASRNPREQVRFNVVVHSGKTANGLQGNIFRRDGFYKELNPTSSGIVITMGTFDYFTSGDLSGESDAEPDVEGPLVDSKLLKKVDVYKASHHGSDTSNSPKLMDVIDPSLVVVSVGDAGQNTNSFHLPRMAPILDMHARLAKKPEGLILQMSCGAGNVMPTHPFCAQLFPINEAAEAEKAKKGRTPFNYREGEDKDGNVVTGGPFHKLEKFVNTQGDVLVITDGSTYSAVVPHHPTQPKGRIVRVQGASRLPFGMTPEAPVTIGPFRTDGR